MIKRLKKQAGNFEYKFKSTIIVNFSDDNSFDAEQYNLREVNEYESKISEAVDADMNEMGPSGLAKYMDEPLKSKIDSIIVSVENCSAITTVKANTELSNEEKESVEEYIEGQFSDGWGEGFEQNPIDSYTDYNAGIVEQEDGEFEEEEYEYEVEITASFWKAGNWNIEQIQ